MTIRFEHRGESAFAGALAPMDKVTGLKTGHYGREKSPVRGPATTGGRRGAPRPGRGATHRQNKGCRRNSSAGGAHLGDPLVELPREMRHDAQLPLYQH